MRQPTLILWGVATVVVVGLLGGSGVEAVVGGEDTLIEEAPYAAAFVVRAGSSDIAKDFVTCGASLLNNRWALTAFKCVMKAPASDDRSVFDTEHMRLRIGSGLLPHAQLLKVLFVVANDTHPDLALLKLEANITDFGNSTHSTHSSLVTGAISLASSPPLQNETLFLASFGSDAIDGFGLPPSLQSFSAPFNANFSCGLSASQQASDQYVCHGSTDPIKTACAADYGAALLNEAGEVVALYLQSEGDQSSHANCRGHGVYTRIDAAAAAWVQDTILNFTEPLASASSSLLFPSSSSSLLFASFSSLWLFALSSI